jgi:hypothetical protein
LGGGFLDFSPNACPHHTLLSILEVKKRLGKSLKGKTRNLLVVEANAFKFEECECRNLSTNGFQLLCFTKNDECRKYIVLPCFRISYLLNAYCGPSAMLEDTAACAPDLIPVLLSLQSSEGDGQGTSNQVSQ